MAHNVAGTNWANRVRSELHDALAAAVAEEPKTEAVTMEALHIIYDEVVSLKSQRDELLAACKAEVDALKVWLRLAPLDVAAGVAVSHDLMMAAIAKAEGRGR